MILNDTLNHDKWYIMVYLCHWLQPILTKRTLLNQTSHEDLGEFYQDRSLFKAWNHGFYNKGNDPLLWPKYSD